MSAAVNGDAFFVVLSRAEAAGMEPTFKMFDSQMAQVVSDAVVPAFGHCGGMMPQLVPKDLWHLPFVMSALPDMSKDELVRLIECKPRAVRGQLAQGQPSKAFLDYSSATHRLWLPVAELGVTLARVRESGGLILMLASGAHVGIAIRTLRKSWSEELDTVQRLGQPWPQDYVPGRPDDGSSPKIMLARVIGSR